MEFDQLTVPARNVAVRVQDTALTTPYKKGRSLIADNIIGFLD